MKTTCLAAAGFLAATVCAHAGDDPIEDARALALQIAGKHGVVGLIGGVDTNAALRTLADGIVMLDQRIKETEARRPVYGTCFQFTLTVNESVSPETAEFIARELRGAVPKIQEACASIGFTKTAGCRDIDRKEQPTGYELSLDGNRVSTMGHNFVWNGSCWVEEAK